jgi:hypothetical protein
VTQPPPETTPPVLPDGATPKPKSGIGRTIIIAAVALVVGFAIGSTTGFEETPSDDTTSTTGAPDTTTTTEAPETTTTTAPTTTTEAPAVVLEPSDFTPNIIVIESSCFGSAGANVTFEVEWGWPGEAFGTLTYEIRGLDDGATNIASTAIVGTQYEIQRHVVGIPTCDPETITVVPTLFRAD